MKILYSSLIMFSTIFLLWGCAATPGSPEAVAEEEKEKKKAAVKATKKAVGEISITPALEDPKTVESNKVSRLLPYF